MVFIYSFIRFVLYDSHISLLMFTPLEVGNDYISVLHGLSGINI